MMGFFTSPRISLGPGSIEQLSSLGARRAFLLVDPAVETLGGHRRIQEEIEKDGAHVAVSHAVAISPTLDSLEPGARAAAESQPDLIVAVGGGSTIDTAKGIWLRYARPDLELHALTPLTELRLRDRARFVALPTTSGSGSDATWTAQFWDATGRPVEIASRELIPDWALLDPTLPATMPAPVAADSAVDAMTHALEALASPWATPFTDGYARESIAILARGLSGGPYRTDDPEEGGRIQAAATMAGLALSNAHSGLVHAIAHAIGPRTGLSHGRLVAILLPWVLEFNFPAARETYSSLGSILGPATVQHAAPFADWFRRLNVRLGIPPTLGAAGVDVAALRDSQSVWLPYVRSAPSLGANPRVPSLQELMDLFMRTAE